MYRPIRTFIKEVSKMLSKIGGALLIAVAILVAVAIASDQDTFEGMV